MLNLQPFYYSGSKWSKADTVVPHILAGLRNHPEITEYREPFFGSGAIGIHLLGRVPRMIDYWLNDIDPALACWWYAVRDCPDQLITAVNAADPNTQLIEASKKRLAHIYRVPETAAEIVEIALAKLVMHQCRFYGFGAGLRGGRDQAKPARNHITARWRPTEIVSKILAISGHFRLRQVRFSQRQCWHLIEDDAEHRTLIYCDPPYLRTTHARYMRKFALSDHVRLAETLGRSAHAFAVSHRINTQIRDLYAGWAEITEVDEVDMLIMRWS